MRARPSGSVPTNPNGHGVSWAPLVQWTQVPGLPVPSLLQAPETEMHTVLSTLLTAFCHWDPKRSTETPVDPWWLARPLVGCKGKNVGSGPIRG